MLGFFPTKKWPKQVKNAPFLKIRNFFLVRVFERLQKFGHSIASDSEKMYRASIGPFFSDRCHGSHQCYFYLIFLEELDVNRALNKSKILIHSHCNPRHITYITHIFILLLILSVR